MDRSLRSSRFPCAGEESQTVVLGCEGDLGALGEVEDVAGYGVGLVARLVGDVEVAF